jgi:Tol biopolymer transport system component
MIGSRRRRRVGTALVAASALALPLGAVGAEDVRRPTGTIAFTASPAPFGQGDVYAVRADGSHLRQLTSNPAPEQGATWAPDGKSIAYVRATGRGALYRLFLNGRKPQLLFRESSSTTAFPSDPVWSPDGRRIAFTSQRTGDVAIWTIGLDGTLTQVTRTFGSHATWSPTGKQLAYSGLAGVVIVGFDGSAKRTIYRKRNGGETPVWSPDGKWIAFRNVDRIGPQREVDSLHVISPSGRSARRLIRGGVILPVAWSPSSDAILCIRGSARRPEQRQLFIVPLSGGRPRPVPGTNGVLGGASWHR